MREHGCIHSGGGLGANGHACWAFEEADGFAAAAVEFLADGLRAGEQLAYVGSEPVDEQRERLDPLGDVGSMIDAGGLLLLQLGNLYKAGGQMGAAELLTLYGAATDGALAAGYSGLRVAVQATDLVGEPQNWNAHVRMECVVDRFMAARPLSGLCGYRRDALPEGLLADLATVHPAANEGPPEVPFHLFSDSGNAVVAGEVDAFSAPDLDHLLGLALEDGEEVSLDLAELDFIDHHGLEVLVRHTERLAATGACEVRNAPPVAHRLCDLLELTL
jgi:anti-anti-sigma regulatory factor